MNFARTFLAGTAILTLFVGFAAVGTGIAYVRKIEPTLPDIQSVIDWRPKEGTTILAVDGTVLGVHASEFRKYVPYGEIPPVVVNAFVAAEDGQFWTHKGVNPVAMARALLSNLKGGRVLGASTISQQVVKNILLTPERTIDRKIKEVLLAIKVDKAIGKQKIVEIYLNESYLGEGAYGVAAAAKTYFGKDVSQLTVSEAAVLAALPQAPSVVNPVKNMTRTLERRNYVLGRMLAEGYIDNATYGQAVTEPVVVTRGGKEAARETEYAFRSPEEAVRRALVSSLGSERVYKDGGTVRTTVDPDLQRISHRELRIGLVHEDRRSGWQGPLADGVGFPVNWDDEALAPPPGAEDWKVGVVAEAGRDAIVETRDGQVTVTAASLAWTSRKKASSLLEKGDVVLIGDLGNGPEIVSIPRVQGAVVVLDPATGAIRAMDGGFSAEESEFNRATQAKRQTGSVFKSFVYLSALEMGFDAMSPILDRPIAIEQGPGLADWRPTSHDAGLGLITLRRSLELSRNESTVRLVYDLGLDQVAETARRAGIRLPEKLTYSMALGTAETTPLNVAEAYATLANGGHHIQPTFVPAEGPVSLEGRPSEFDPIAVAQLSSILEGVTYAGTARNAFDGFDKPISAKTGTTDQSKDAWFASYGPRFVLVVWVGRDDSKPLAKGAAGGVTAGRIARGILDHGSADFQFDPFELPDGTETVVADRATGLPNEKGDVVEIVRTEEPTHAN
ncbi:transglycosylase domain-containing protein [Pararhizobium sp. BT-229]|uniref:penicillin-binding protein 1A n=1 Tax=Pararhizobium sp. BT-229 TaxID=2986923 RepID=UPI0021F6AADB|nr:transglycosylase domain-containing protein [Pararhizobium sp. BT-229]MCV9965139.1 transglycosylase domain-containing protein [Pararhizobium sp. BT-229]